MNGLVRGWRFLMIVMLIGLVSGHSFDQNASAELDMCDLYNVPTIHTPEYMGLAVIVLVIMFALVILTYLLGKLTSSSLLLSWSNKEMGQLILNAFLLIFLMVIWNILDDLGRVNNPVDPSLNLIQSAQLYIRTIRNVMLDLTRFLFTINNTFHIMNTVSVKFGLKHVLELSFEDKGEGVLAPVVSVMDWLFTLVATMVFTWMGKDMLLCMVVRFLVPLLLPLGIVLRCFSATRSVGGGLIALSFALYFVYPFMLNLNNIIVANHFNAQPSDVRTGAQSLSTPVYNSPSMGYIISAYSMTKSELILGSMIAVVPFLWFVAFHMEAMFLEWYLPVTTYYIFVVSIILPIINLTITFSVVRELGSILGSDMNFKDLLNLL